MILYSTLISAAALVLGSAVATADAVPASQVEAVYGYITTPSEITFQVHSGGCTKKEHFTVTKQQNPVDGTIKVALIRVTPDYCRGFFVHGKLVAFTLSELGLEGAYFQIQNPTGHPFAKVENN